MQEGLVPISLLIFAQPHDPNNRGRYMHIPAQPVHEDETAHDHTNCTRLHVPFT